MDVELVLTIVTNTYIELESSLKARTTLSLSLLIFALLRLWSRRRSHGCLGADAPRLEI